jgi:putative thiamine transport system substrate-binding protein
MGFMSFGVYPQGSSCLATLGWKSQSLWDWATKARRWLCHIQILTPHFPNPFLTRFALMGLLILISTMAPALGAAESDWASVLAKARGQTVYWNAWAGDERINAYIAWTARQVEDNFGVKVRHVKLADTAEAVTRVLAEKAARKNDNGSADLIWINGENFSAMKKHGLLYGPFTTRLPNFHLVDTENKSTQTDFTLPVEGLEAPWSMAQLVFIYDSVRVPEPPRTIPALFTWAKAHPGRFTFPQPPVFLGTTFLKQALLGLAKGTNDLSAPATEADFTRITAPLWDYLDKLQPLLWRQGRAFPSNGPAQRRLLADGEIDLAISFSPDEASSSILNGQLPPTTRTFVLEGGTIGNASFLAIPYNSRAKEGALVLINFLLSPQAQARKQDPRIMGSLTVLAMEKLSAADRKLFDDLPRGPATLSMQELGKPLPEPHPFWMERLETEWQKRYGAGR